MHIPAPARRLLLALHAAAILVHGLSGAAGVALNGGELARTLTYTTPAYYSGIDPATLGACPVTSNDFTVTYTTHCSSWSWNGLTALTVMEFVTVAFHAYYILELWMGKSAPDALQWEHRRAHPARWVEYSITATILSLATLAGVGERSLALFATVGAVAPLIHAFGALAELLYGMRTGIDAHLKHALVWTLFALGCVPQLVVFGLVALSLGSAGSGVTTTDGTSDFDGWSIQSAAYFAHYFAFPAIFLLYICGRIRVYWLVETSYVAASVGSKLALFWLVVSTVRRYTERYGATGSAGVSWDGVFWAAIVIPPLITICVPLVAALTLGDGGAEDVVSDRGPAASRTPAAAASKLRARGESKALTF